MGNVIQFKQTNTEAPARSLVQSHLDAYLLALAKIDVGKAQIETDIRVVSVILAASTPSALAAKSATTTIPIVFAIGGDPVRTGLVGSLNRPGGNLTGAAHINVDTAAKRLELLHELVPSKKSFGLLLNPNNPLAASIEAEVRPAAETLGVQLSVLRASTDEGIEAAFKAATGGTIVESSSALILSLPAESRCWAQSLFNTESRNCPVLC